jgi:hypothetical protein
MSHQTESATPACEPSTPLPPEPARPDGETPQNAATLATASAATPLKYHDLLLDARIRQRVEWCRNSGHPLPDNLQQAVDHMEYMSERWLNDDVGRAVDRIRLWINTNLRRECDEPALTLVGEQVRLRRPSLTADEVSRLPVMEIAAILFEAAEPDPRTRAGDMQRPPADGAESKATAVGITWQEAAERLERLRGQGESFTGQSKIAEQLGCSSATINKAIKNTPSLQKWAKPTATSAPKAQSLNEVFPASPVLLGR